MSSDTLPDAMSEDAFLGGRVRLRQPVSGNRAGLDALLLAAAVPARDGERLTDFGAGSGIAGLAVAARCGSLDLLAVDSDPAMVELAASNFALNGANGRAIRADLTASGAEREAAGLAPDAADHVIANPPFLDPAAARLPPEASRAGAFGADPGDLDIWLRAAVGHVRPGGTVTVIHRADALDRLLAAMTGRLGDVAILPVLPRADSPAIRVIAQGVKGSRAPLRLLPPLVLHVDGGNGYTARARAILEDGRALDLR